MTELIWNGKYKDGRKCAPVRLALPFQDVETVNESAQQRQMTLDLFGRNQAGDWRNRLIWGDKKYVLPSLLPEFAGKVLAVDLKPLDLRQQQSRRPRRRMIACRLAGLICGHVAPPSRSGQS